MAAIVDERALGRRPGKLLAGAGRTRHGSRRQLRHGAVVRQAQRDGIWQRNRAAPLLDRELGDEIVLQVEGLGDAAVDAAEVLRRDCPDEALRRELAGKLVPGQNHNPQLRQLVYSRHLPRQLVTAQIERVKIRETENLRRNRPGQPVITQAKNPERDYQSTEKASQPAAATPTSRSQASE
nr:hypothetical protein Iba_chr12dCG22340 [Ipomoea batatas]GME10332.1 hypothetical protein Iba_scaffold9920CG0130 [Ipomoea batatas]